MPLFIGQLVSDRYRVDSLVDQDDSGVVYRAWDLRLNTAVTFIENLDTSEAARQQFSDEADQLTHLSHSNLPRILDHFNLPQQGQYLVMDVIEGETLQARLDADGALPQVDALNWMAQVTEAVAYLRRQSALPEMPSLQPADILVRPDGRVTLMGFGLLMRHTPGKRESTPGQGIIPGYSAPELYGNNEVDERSDVYQLGATLYYLLTNQQPPESIQLATGSARLMSPAQLNPDVTPPVEQLIFRAMSPDAGRRFQSLEEFRHQLLAVKFQPAAPPPSPAGAAPVVDAQAAPPSSMSRLWPVILGGLGFLLGVVLVSVVYFSFIGGDGQPSAEGAAPQATAPRQTRTLGSSGEAEAAPASTSTSAALVDFPTATSEPLVIEAADGTPAAAGAVTPGGNNEPVAVVEEPALGALMVLVPGGPFTMGGLSGGEDSLPAHTVNLPDFYIDQYEVTNAHYRACVEAGACQSPGNTASYTRRDYFDNPQFDDYPALQVSWEQAFTFCAWREARLPTEAEWEKAARGDDERTFPWGEGIDCNTANWATSSGACVGDTTAVGSYPGGASPYGAMDMAGNVWEWVADWYSPTYYADSPEDSPKGPDQGELKVLRGGSWVSNELSVRSAFRNNLEPASASSNIGFRCVRLAAP